MQPPPPPSRRRRRLLLAAAIVTVAAIIGVAWWLARDDEPPSAAGTTAPPAADPGPAAATTTRPPGTVITIPDEQLTLPPATIDPVQAAEEATCATVVAELEVVARDLLAEIEGKTVAEAAEQIEELRRYEDRVRPILDEGRRLGCTQDDLRLICRAVDDLEPRGQAARLAYAALREGCR